MKEGHPQIYMLPLTGFNNFLCLYESLAFMMSNILFVIWTKQIKICFHLWRRALSNCHRSRHCSCFQSLVRIFWFFLLMKGLTAGGCSLRPIHLNDKHCLLRHFQDKCFRCLTCHIHWCVKMLLGFFLFWHVSPIICRYERNNYISSEQSPN